MTTKLTKDNLDLTTIHDKGINWQSVITADGSTSTSAVAGYGYFIDTTSATHTINLPTNPEVGDSIAIKDYAGTFGTNALTIGRNGNNIQGVANDSQISTNKASVILVYVDSTKGWLFENESNVADLGQALFTVATGGTITTDGDYKIHVFTGDGCFSVTTAGNAPTVPTGGPNTVEYFVVAGGGAGFSQYGGGGAGGFRMSVHSSPTTNPLNAPVCSLVSVGIQNYPIVVGAGGSSAGPYPCGGFHGNDSSFSTITSSGGGSGPSELTYGPGGSGGGGTGEPPGSAHPGGAGNTPPTSPPQGNPGGQNTVGSRRGGGGGGAGAAGAGPGSATGGAGSYIPTTWLGPVAPSYGVPGPNGRYFSGGGGGGTEATPGSPYPGGLGGGGAGGNQSAGTPGTTNTGGGGGSSSRGTASSGGPYGIGSGGSGIVILKYKYQ